MQKLTFKDYIETVAHLDGSTGDLPIVIRWHGALADVTSWPDLEDRLRREGADVSSRRAAKRLHYRVASRSSLGGAIPTRTAALRG